MIKVFAGEGFCDNQTFYNNVLSLLGEEYKSQFVLSKSQNGAPYIKDSRFFVSISHSNNVVIFAISDERIGVDIEFLKPRNYAKIAQKYFNINNKNNAKNECIDIDSDKNNAKNECVAQQNSTKTTQQQPIECDVSDKNNTINECEDSYKNNAKNVLTLQQFYSEWTKFESFVKLVGGNIFTSKKDYSNVKFFNLQIAKKYVCALCLQKNSKIDNKNIDIIMLVG